MKCENAFDRYLALDKNEWVPFRVTLHLIICPTCRTGVRKMTRAEKNLASPLGLIQAVNSDDSKIALALERITAAGLAYSIKAPADSHVSLFRWLISGVALIAGFAIIPFTSIGIWSTSALGKSFSVPFYILCGVAITAYCGMFVGTNIDFFIKKFGIQHTA